jgi:signal peptidase I
MKRLLNLKTLSAAIGFVLLILIWIFFAPIQLGGHSYFVIVNGNSMEPLFHKGDLVFLRTANEYVVGDIVVYKYPGIGNVFHRIVGINESSYQMKGDNNSWIDSYYPQKNEILAKYWFVFKNSGKYLTFIKSPWIIALIAGLFCAIIGVSMITQTDKKNSTKKRGAAAQMGYKIANWRNGYWWSVYALGLLAVVLGIFAFTQPFMQTATKDIPYQQTGKFSYTGQAGQDIYDTKEIQTGDPIYTTLSCNINFLFDYSLVTDSIFIGGGTYSVNAVLQANNGWKRSFLLVPETQFSGNTFHSDASFNTCSLETIIQNTSDITKVENLQYSLLLTPTVKIDGKLAGQVLADSFTPNLTFMVDPLELYLPASNTTETDPFHPTASGKVVSSFEEINTLPIFIWKLPVQSARNIAIIATLLALLGIAIPTALFKRASKNDRTLEAKMLMGPMLVETQVSPVSGNERIVDLTSFEDLAALSERSNSTVFFHQQPLYTDYLVRENTLVYRFRQMITLPEGKEKDVIESEIYRALQNNEFLLFYQPIYSLQDGRIMQVESLLRWQHPQKGLLMASEFLPFAEKSELICLIDNWVLQKACEQLREWKDSGSLRFNLAINISIQQLRDPSLAKYIEDALLENQLRADCLSIEIFLDQLLFDAAVMNNMKQIRQLGVKITVKSDKSGDISMLHQLEGIDQLKISPNLVKKAVTDTGYGNVTRGIIEEAHRNKVGVTAVGIETSEEMGFFRLNACDGIQGNILSKPLPYSEFDKILNDKKVG